ncbi:MAG TPA: tRNA epoxyqueuosine(34) reductase QueG [Thermoanaerobaculia bacterium]|nr:tRNA epoxyqueuosine(34) reductase QueG [Thermoanaerobaculia bacterium]
MTDGIPRAAGSGSSPASRADLLRAWAHEAGFDRVGVAEVRWSDHGGPFRDWLARGDQAGMAWLERRVELRLDPSRLFEGCRSVVCVALHYWPLEGSSDPEGDLWPWVARYARGEDYHQVMGRQLDHLAERVREAFPGANCRWYVDTGPVLERELAQRAGLGRIGKNTNLLHRWGSWFLLGELFLDLELEPDEALADMCGTCTRCLEACPTGALPEPYRLDSRRCISYWTIEHRGPLPSEVRASIGDWVFGCDICQEVCPWNGLPGRDGVTAHRHPELELAGERRAVDLAGLLALDGADHQRMFRATAMHRAKPVGLRRNAAVAMGNRGNERYVAPLVGALEDEDPTVRGHAAWALGRIGGGAARAGLRTALRREVAPAVRAELLAALDRPPESSAAGEDPGAVAGVSAPSFG